MLKLVNTVFIYNEQLTDNINNELSNITYTDDLLVRRSSDKEILFVLFWMEFNAVSNFTTCKP